MVKLPFAPFSGYNEYIKKPHKGSLPASETGDQNAGSQETPRTVGPNDANKIAQDTESENKAAVRTSDGKTVSLPCGEEGKETGTERVITKIKNAIQQFVEFIQDLKPQFDEDIEYYRDWIKREIVHFFLSFNS